MYCYTLLQSISSYFIMISCRRWLRRVVRIFGRATIWSRRRDTKILPFPKLDLPRHAANWNATKHCHARTRLGSPAEHLIWVSFDSMRLIRFNWKMHTSFLWWTVKSNHSEWVVREQIGVITLICLLHPSVQVIGWNEMTILCDPLPIAKEMLVHNIWTLPPIPATRSFNVRFR